MTCNLNTSVKEMFPRELSFFVRLIIKVFFNNKVNNFVHFLKINGDKVLLFKTFTNQLNYLSCIIYLNILDDAQFLGLFSQFQMRNQILRKLSFKVLH